MIWLTPWRMYWPQAIKLGFIALALRSRSPSRPGRQSGQQFDWDRYHDRQDACREKDRSAAECVGGVDYCDEPAVRQARRACSAFGPLGERR